MKIVLYATYPTLTTGYARIANRIGNYFASLPDVDITHVGFENYPGCTISDRFVDPRIRLVDVAAMVDPVTDRFGHTILPKIVEETKPDILLIYNDAVVTSQALNHFMTKDHPFKIISYLDLVYPWEIVEFVQHIDRWSDRIFTFSKCWRDHLIDGFGLQPSKIGVFRHGFDAETFAPMPRSDARARLNLDPDDYIVLNTNRNSYRKGLDITIFAFLRFWKSIGCPANVRLFLNCRTDVKDGYDILNLIRVECLRLGVSYDDVSSRHIMTMGNASGVLDEATHRALHNAANVGLNTCVGEGVGLAQLEGAGLGIPQIATDTGGLHDIFADMPENFGCRLIKPRASLYLAGGIDSHGGEIAISDPDDFADALREIYKGRDDWDAVGLRQNSIDTYAWDKHLGTFADDIFRLIPASLAPSLVPSLQPSASAQSLAPSPAPVVPSARSPSSRSLAPSPSARSLPAHSPTVPSLAHSPAARSLLPIYWINLDRRTDRRAFMESQFERFGVTHHHRIRAKEPKDGTTAEIACMKSHFEAIRRAYSDGHDAALILEDDVVFFPEKGIPNSPLPLEDFDIVQLHYCCPALLEAAKQFLPPEKASVVVLKGYLMSCAAYVISRAGMRRFLDVMTDVHFLPDARAEEFVYRYVPRVFCPLIPAVTIAAEEFESDVPSSDHAAGIENARILKSYEFPVASSSVVPVFWELPYDVHWFGNVEDVHFSPNTASK
jgi:glycosyltransferase involved in cell wall biosynthesis